MSEDERFSNGFEARAWEDAVENHRARRREMLTDDQQRLCAFVRAHPALLDALYDLDLTPEQALGTDSWPKTARVVALYAEAAGIEPPWLTPAAEALCSAVFLARADVRPAASSPVCARCGGAHVPLEPPRAPWRSR